MTASENTYMNCISLLDKLYKDHKIGAEAYIKLDSAMKDLYKAGYDEGYKDGEKYTNLF